MKKKIYHATKGLGTGNPLSVELATLVPLRKELQQLEEGRLTNYFRYIDDTFVFEDARLHENVKETLKDVFQGYTLTFEEEKNGGLAFLDLWIFKGPHWRGARPSYAVSTKVFQKEQNLYQYLHWGSSHPKSVYESIITGEVTRYIKRCTHKSDFEEIKKLFRSRLKKRGYPKRFMDKAFRKAPTYERRTELLDKVLNKTNNNQVVNEEQPEQVLRFKYVYEKAYNDSKSIRKILLKHWDTLPPEIKRNKLQLTTCCKPNLYRTLYCWPLAIKEKEPKKFFANYLYEAPMRQRRIEEFFRPLRQPQQRRKRPRRSYQSNWNHESFNRLPRVCEAFESWIREIEEEERMRADQAFCRQFEIQEPEPPDTSDMDVPQLVRYFLQYQGYTAEELLGLFEISEQEIRQIQAELNSNVNE